MYPATRGAMITLGGNTLGTSLKSMLCMGAHCDDIEIGCGGTILKLLEANPGLRVDWIVFSSDEVRSEEARTSAAAFLRAAGESNVAVENFRGRYFPYVAAELKEYFDRLGEDLAPDIVFTHYGGDLHQDHRLLAELTWNTFRDHLILEYEIPKYDGDLGRPNAFVYLERSHCEEKLRRLLEAFPSQRTKRWFSEETFRATLRLRGIESASPSGYAEGFHCRKVVLA